MLKVTTVVVLAFALAGCTSGSSTAASTPGSATTTSASPTPQSSTPSLPLSATSDDPQLVAESLKSQIPEIGAIVKITENNDSNNLIGRPGQYDAASFVQDKRLPCTAQGNFNDLATSCGAKVERWASNADAKTRVADIQKKLKAYGLGAEYDYVRDVLVLRVSGDLKPSQVKAYHSAFGN